MNNFNGSRICLSIVSHGQASMIYELLSDLARLPLQNFEVLVTVNVPEDESVYQGHPFPLQIIRNDTSKGFGENHNSAFERTSCEFFLVVNPDIRISSFSFLELLAPFDNKKVAAVAPIVISSVGNVEDSARKFPTLLRFAKRILMRQRGLDYQLGDVTQSVDWLAGMFVAYRSEAYRQVQGFDHRRFFMYLEDADICRRLHENGFDVLINPAVSVIHNAQRASRRNWKHMRWHLVSAVRYLTGI